jgi:NhaA family Na+:H+ antiporter
VHATVAGVLLAFAVPARSGLAEHFEHRFRPISAGVAVPLFAFLTAGVTLGGPQALADTLADPIALGVIAGLVAGKAAGVTAATWLVARFTKATLGDGLGWVDVVGLGLLGGIGFTVSLLVGELAFGYGTPRTDVVTLAVLAGSVGSALLASVVLRLRDRAYRRLQAAEAVDEDDDGVPDAYQADQA